MSDPSPPRPTYAPPVGYAAPSGFPAPYTSTNPPQGSADPFAPAPSPRSSATGLVALFAALAAVVLAPVLAIVAGINIGEGLGGQSVGIDGWTGDDLSILTPVREWVLLGEIAFWAGTLLGIWAIIQGIVAIVQRAGRVQGIIAVVLAAVGPVVFAFAVQLALALGFAL